MWNTIVFASRVFASPPSRPAPASPRRTGTPVPSGLQHIVSAAASPSTSVAAALSPSASSAAAISRPTCRAQRSARFAVAATPATSPNNSAARAQLISAHSLASARIAAGVSRTPDRPTTPSAASSGCVPPFEQPRVQ